MAIQKRKGVLRGIRGILIKPYVSDPTANSGMSPSDEDAFGIKYVQNASQEADIEEGEVTTHTGSGFNVLSVRDPDQLLGYNVNFVQSDINIVDAQKLIGGNLIHEDPEDTDSPVIGWDPPNDLADIPHVYMEIYIRNYDSDDFQQGYAVIVLPHVRVGYPTIPEQNEEDFLTFEFTAYATRNPNYVSKAETPDELRGPVSYKFVDTLPTQLEIED